MTAAAVRDRLQHALRLDPALEVRLLLNVARPPRDWRDESEFVREFAQKFRREHWPGSRRPAVYYDPRSLKSKVAERAVLHAKCVIVDDRRALVTSANLTGAALYRNVEAGVLVDDPAFAQQLRRQFDALVEARQVRRVPGIGDEY